MSMILEDVRGQPLPAIDVFSLSIKALKDHLDSTIDVKNLELDKRKTKWAGIPRDNLNIALEPEAASIFCQTFPSAGCREIAEIESRYMVVDLGSVLQQCTHALPNISNILLVGGFAECKVIQETTNTNFPNENTVLQEDSSTVVLKGVWPPFDENIHHKNRRVILEGKKYCNNVFSPFMEINTPIPMGYTIETELGTLSPSGCRYQLYYTESIDVEYTDTGECTLLGEFNMYFSNPDRKDMKVTFNFGDTEFSMTVLDPESGSERKEYFESQR
ncbi:unnamed protein product [Mytilus edulis]|uniref:Uncharacterized protein n=1 Tax=Mytilus edulis TaxID=6550 RepID=A0A8S3TF31_MYTED|nr:unnamed protein product [Mytilus edulis]